MAYTMMIRIKVAELNSPLNPGFWLIQMVTIPETTSNISLVMELISGMSCLLSTLHVTHPTTIRTMEISSGRRLQTKVRTSVLDSMVRLRLITGNTGPKASGIVSGMVKRFQELQPMQRTTAIGSGLSVTGGLILMRSPEVKIVTLPLHVMESIER